MINKFIAFLEEKGIQYDSPDNSIIRFRFEGLNYLFQYREQDDPQFIRLVLPRVEDINNNENEIFKRIIEVSSSIKVVKCIIANNEVLLSADQFISSTDNISQVFERMMSVLILAYKHYAGLVMRSRNIANDNDKEKK